MFQQGATWWFRVKTCLLSSRYFEQTISLSAPTSFVLFNLQTFTTNTALVSGQIQNKYSQLFHNKVQNNQICRSFLWQGCIMQYLSLSHWCPVMISGMAWLFIFDSCLQYKFNWFSCSSWSSWYSAGWLSRVLRISSPPFYQRCL